MKLISIPSFNLKKFHSGLLYGFMVMDSLNAKHKLINIKYLDKALINTANYTDCTIVSRPVLYRLFVNGFAVQKTFFLIIVNKQYQSVQSRSHLISK